MALFGNLIGLIGLVCMIWVIYDVLMVNKRLSNLAKVIWILAAIFFSIITAVVYYFFGRK